VVGRRDLERQEVGEVLVFLYTISVAVRVKYDT
jgi:hypothetical protein